MGSCRRVFQAKGTASAGPTVEGNEETKSGVAVVWGPSQRLACNEVRKVSGVQNCRALQGV